MNDEPTRVYLAAIIEEGRDFFKVCPQGSEGKKFCIDTRAVESSASWQHPLCFSEKAMFCLQYSNKIW